MTVEERFEFEGVLGKLAQAQAYHTSNLEDLTRIFRQYTESADARMRHVEENIERLEQNIEVLAATLSAFSQSADARMTRIEENLDGLIRAILRDHSNGKTNL